MGIMLDVIVVAIILFNTIIGYTKGLVNVVFNLCAFLIALIITVFLYTPITNFVIENTEFDEKLENVIIENGITGETETLTESGAIEKYLSQSITNTKNDIIQSSSTIIAQKIIGIIIAIALFIIIRLVLVFAKALINGIASLPIIKQLNEVGGLFYGIFIGVVIVYVVLAILFLVISINNNAILTQAINNSIITKILYSNNIVLNLIF